MLARDSCLFASTFLSDAFLCFAIVNLHQVLPVTKAALLADSQA